MKYLTHILKAALISGIASTLFTGCVTTGGTPAVAQPQQRSGKPLEEQVVGYWAPNWEAMSEKWRPMIQSLARLSLGAADGYAQAEKEAEEEIRQGCVLMTMEFTKDQYLQHTGPGRVDMQRYVVKSVDAGSGTIEVDLLPRGAGKPERARLIVSGDRLTFTGPSGQKSTPWIMDRIDRREFQKRQAAAAKSKLFNTQPQTQWSR